MLFLRTEMCKLHAKLFIYDSSLCWCLAVSRLVRGDAIGSAAYVAAAAIHRSDFTEYGHWYYIRTYHA